MSTTDMSKNRPLDGYLWGRYSDGKTRQIASGTWESAEWTGKSLLPKLGTEGMPTTMWVTLSSDGQGKPVWTSEQEASK